MRTLLIILLLTLLPCTAAVGQTGTAFPPFIKVIGENDPLPEISDEDLLEKGVPIRFKVNKTYISPTDSGYLSLRNALLNIPEGYKFCRLLVLRGSASPEGPAWNNVRLAHQRARALADSLRRYVSLPDSTIEERYINEDYAGLRLQMLSSTANYRDRVLEAIAASGSDAETKRLLQKLDNGRTWRLLLRDYFPRLRATRVIMILSRAPGEAEERADLPPVEMAPWPAPQRDTIATPQPEPVPVEKAGFMPWIAVKTNLLYDGLMTPNVEVERWFGKDNRWSVMAEWNFPWWQWRHKSRVYEVNEIGLELRRWWPTRSWDYFSRYGVNEFHPLTGRFLGLYLTGGYYDLEWRYHGEQGDIYSAGLTYGYAIRLSRHWNMEFSASAGYVHSPYTHYEAENHDDILFAKYKKDFNYFGITKLKVSIAWLIGKTKRMKSRPR